MSIIRHLLISGISDEVYDIFSKCSIDGKIGLDHLFFTDVTNPQLSIWGAFQRAKKIIK